MAGLTREVVDALVAVMKGDIDFDELDYDAALAILALAAEPARTRYEAATRLNRDKTFFEIAADLRDQYGIEVDKGTPARWAKRPDVDRRRRPRRRTEPAEADPAPRDQP